MPRALPLFPAFFTLYVAVAMFLLLLGLGPPLAKAIPELAELFEVWGEGQGPVSALWRGMAEADHFSEGLVRLTVDYLFSALNVGLGLFIVWQRPRDTTARLLGLALVGTGLVLNIASHSALITTWFFLNGLHVGVHALSGAAYVNALLVFPNGKLVPRWALWLLAVGYLVLSAAFSFYYIPTIFGGNFEDIGFSGTDIEIYEEIVTLDAALSVFFFGLLIPVVGVGAQMYRYRAILTPAERQQTKLVVWSIVVAFGAALVYLALAVLQNASQWTDIGEALHELEELVLFNFPLVFGIVSAALVVSILRYRLWDIDILINRTLVYGWLTGTLGAGYFAGVLILQTVLRPVMDQGGSVAVVVSTLAIAALFQPVRRRIQAIIDRRFYRSRYDAARTLASFARTARDEVDLGRLSETLVRVATAALQPSKVSLWLSQPGRSSEDTDDSR